MARSRESGTGAGGALVMQAAERKRRFERRVRRVAGPRWPAPWVTMKRSMTDGESTTSGRNSRPTEVAKVPSLPAANSRALARAGFAWLAAIATACGRRRPPRADNERGA